MGFKGTSKIWEDPEHCTGLKDKNGNLIYEGDIVHYGKGVNLFVRFGETWGAWNLAKALGLYGNSLICFNSAWEALEIIGNIHQNKDLLK